LLGLGAGSINSETLQASTALALKVPSVALRVTR
jgi:hypothetical protein